MAGERPDVGEGGGALAIGQGPFGLRRQGAQSERPAGILGRQAIEAHGRPRPIRSASAMSSSAVTPSISAARRSASRRSPRRMVSR